MYSQNNEDEIIRDYFGGRKGVLLDIGANDGDTLSNSKLFIENGWDADLVEPSPAAFSRLEKLYGDRDNIGLYNFAITSETGEVVFYECDWHLDEGDISLLSTTSRSEAIRWSKHTRPDGTRQTFTETKVKAFSWADSSLSRQKYSYITIDAEGVDWLILKQIDLSETECLCIEWNSVPEMMRLMSEYTADFGFKVLHSNAENIIFAK